MKEAPFRSDFGSAVSHLGPKRVGKGRRVEATAQSLQAAVLRAQQVEQAGLEAIRTTGQIPRGPPDLPTGTEVIEQKCVAYLIGKSGQALAAINSAAGVAIQIAGALELLGCSKEPRTRARKASAIAWPTSMGQRRALRRRRRLEMPPWCHSEARFSLSGPEDGPDTRGTSCVLDDFR